MPVQITHNSTCVCVCVGVSCGKLYSCERRRQLSTGNWQHSNPISHACNHHDHYERKCRKSRRFLTATERPPSDRATNRPTDRVTPSPPLTFPPPSSVAWFFVSGKLGILFESHSHCSFSWRRHLTVLGIKRRTKLCGMQKVATTPPPTPQPRSGAKRERESGCARRVEAMGSGILCRQQQQQMTLIAFLSALFAASVAVAAAVD